MITLRSFSILMAAFLSACASVDESSTSASTPAPANTVAAPPTASGARQAEARGDRLSPSNPGLSSAPGPVTKAGKPVANSVYFDYDKDEIKPKFRSLLEQHAQYLRANPAIKARIEGNSDERGSREYNLALGQRRAEAVMKNLNLLGIPDSRLEAVSYGEEKPRRAGHEEASWAENRRGDLLVQSGK
jgi:peptidoglycan-associated lipoprotein